MAKTFSEKLNKEDKKKLKLLRKLNKKKSQDCADAVVELFKDLPPKKW